MKFRTPFNYDTDVASFSSGLDCSNDVDRAQQHMKDETDINRLVKVYARTGIPGADIPATEVVFDDVFDFQSAMNAVRQAEEGFARLPADLRKRFHYDPGEFLSFIDDADNRAEAEKLGLVLPRQPQEPAPAPVPENKEPVKD